MTEILKAIEVDASTGIIIERDFTDQEIADTATAQAEFESQQEAKAAARESALAKLAELGLTAEEIAAL
jgi:DNA-binding NarL/FixJ family response regulator